MSIKRLIADDQALIRSGLRAIIESEPGMEVAGEAGDGAAPVPTKILILTTFHADGSEVAAQRPRPQVHQLTARPTGGTGERPGDLAGTGWPLKCVRPGEVIAARALPSLRGCEAAAAATPLVERELHQ